MGRPGELIKIGGIFSAIFFRVVAMVVSAGTVPIRHAFIVQINARTAEFAFGKHCPPAIGEGGLIIG